MNRIKEFTDNETGEIVPVMVIDTEEKDFNKIWFSHFVNNIDGIASPRAKLLSWIVENMDSENQIFMTQGEIAKQANVNIKTVNKTLKSLSKHSEDKPAVLQKMHNGVYRVNPEILYKGSYTGRFGVCFNNKGK
jgi:hypothetical protein